MAREKFYTTNISIETSEAKTKWNTALYIRLSRNDNDKVESDSVVNQRNLLTDYINEHIEFQLINTYIDDGYTGTNFNRPHFNEMVNDIQTGKVNCVIVKDLSRFGRDYIGAGKYLEQLFPALECRFISILDNLDSYERPNEINSVFVRFKHIMNDHYSNEISQKLRYYYDKQRKKGKLVSAFAPYGYLKDPKDHCHLIIDDEVADVIRKMFNWALKGMGSVRIAQKLNNLGILPPGLYRKEKGIYKSHNNNCGLYWRPDSVRTILNNKVYTGVLEQKKITTRNHKDRKKIYVDEQECILVLNTHEPIIDEKTFTEVQNGFRKCVRTSPNEDTLYLFSGFLRCSDCNSAMIRSSKFTKGKLYVYYKCRMHNQISKIECPYSHSINHEILKESVLYAIKTQIYAVANMQKVIDKVNATKVAQSNTMNFGREIAKRNRKIKTKNSLKRGLYEDWKTGTITRNEYIQMKEDYNQDIIQLEKSISELKSEEKAVQDMQTNNIEWINNFTQYLEIKELTRDLLFSLVDTIYIDKDKNICIDFLHQNEFSRITKYITDNIDGGEEIESIKYISATASS